MTSSEGLTSIEPWSFRQSFNNNNNIDSWLLPDPFSHDSDLLAKALHRSISTSTTTDSLHADPLSPSAYFDSAAVSDFSPPQTLSNVSFGSDPEIAAYGGAKRKRGPGLSGVKPPKRRSRVSTKKSQTTFITADAANFRQMVQEVTGAKFVGSSHGILSPIVKPEPHRLASRTLDRSSALPTLDTSSFLSNHHQELGSVSAPISLFHRSGAANTAATADGVGGGSAVELDSYPTLESWKVM
ncbi:hypothetical protein EUTSA_v10006505mg [Eutrema salsugineum]|uniref:VQ domain-containing protein n=1 Tax=Eutrema salsugineum TaxID=72664 RepID=V4NE95_EUTSA|nr:calmodulin-binding protein 25 [Eutrema salsugineum]ESQ44391.1 hypothetical protein EUTSA_v10006505mg [Eutrema salsugineum]